MNLSIFETIDEEQTLVNVKNYFDYQLPRLERLAGETIGTIQSPSYDGQPKGSPATDSQARRIVQKVDAQQAVRATRDAISRCDQTSQHILHGVFISGDTDEDCYKQIGYSSARYYRHFKPLALMEFAEAFDYDDLKAYKVEKE